MNKKYISEQLNIENKVSINFKPDDYNDILSDISYLNMIYIKLNLPAIYSSSRRKFKWNKYLGYNIIDKVHCQIFFKSSSNIIELNLYTYSEWLYIWYEINLSESEKKLHYDLIGHTPELYNPELYNNNIYPASNLQKQFYKWIINDNDINKATYINIENDIDFNKPPSINSKTIYIPLNFSFCNDINNILPLNKINNIKFTVNFKDYTELYTILLQPEDFIISDDSNNLSTLNYEYNDFELPPDIIFTDNNTITFSKNKHIINNNLDNNPSIFDTIINEYRILPLKNNLTSINKFLLKEQIINSELLSFFIQQFGDDPTFNLIDLKNSLMDSEIYIKDSLESQDNYTKNSFYNLCKPHIIYTIIIDETIKTKNSWKVSGIFNEITSQQYIPQIISNSKTGNTDADNTNLTLKIENNINNISEIFFYFKHGKRNEKNDFLNFTNYNYNNNSLWNTNIINNFNKINIINNNSIWNSLLSYNNIIFDINELGLFTIKKKIKEDNTNKYINILEYQTSLEYNNNMNIYDVNSYKYFNEKIIDNFSINLFYNNNNNYIYTNNTENYNFYNKVLLYNYYKGTVPGLYYININNNIKNIEKILLKNVTFNSLNIEDNNIYYYYIFNIDNKNIIFS